MNNALLYGGGLAAVLYLASGGGDATPGSIEEATSNVAEEIRTWVPVTEDGELGLGLSGDQWVLYDDPEEGEHDDEAGDDANVSFDAAGVDGSTYAPDNQDGTTTSGTGVFADAGGSQNWGDAGEQENDDLTERTAESNLSDAEKSSFDHLANYDDTEKLDSHQDDEVTSSGSNYSTISDSSSSDDEEEEKDPFAHLYDDGVTGSSSGLVE